MGKWAFLGDELDRRSPPPHICMVVAAKNAVYPVYHPLRLCGRKSRSDVSNPLSGPLPTAWPISILPFPPISFVCQRLWANAPSTLHISPVRSMQPSPKSQSMKMEDHPMDVNSFLKKNASFGLPNARVPIRFSVQCERFKDARGLLPLSPPYTSRSFGL